jgi:hypothetical protein
LSSGYQLPVAEQPPVPLPAVTSTPQLRALTAAPVLAMLKSVRVSDSDRFVSS